MEEKEEVDEEEEEVEALFKGISFRAKLALGSGASVSVQRYTTPKAPRPISSWIKRLRTRRVGCA